MKLTKPEARRVRQALNIAIDSEIAYLDCWRVDWDKRTHKPRRVIPATERQMAQTVTRRLAAFRKLLAKLQSDK